jgi:sugar/nucleoside kinase (ribokinase family)
VRPHRAARDRRAFDLLVAGELNPDVMVVGVDVSPPFGQAETLVNSIGLEIGSSSAISACAAARLGLRTAFVGVVGDDDFGRFMLGALEKRGIDVSACRVDPSVPTGASVILTSGADRAIMTATGTIDQLHPQDVSEVLLASARHLHVGSTYLQPDLARELPGVLGRARAAGLTTSVDTNWDPSESWDGGIDDLLCAVDVFLPNLQEARMISRRQDATEAAMELVRRAVIGRETGRPFVLAMKLGRDGGMAFRSGANLEVAKLPGLPVGVVDTTGAGDSFDAGFLFGFIAGWPIRQSLELAIACGSLSVQGVGGTAAQPTLPEARKAIAAARANAAAHAAPGWIDATAGQGPTAGQRPMRA